MANPFKIKRTFNCIQLKNKCDQINMHQKSEFVNSGLDAQLFREQQARKKNMKHSLQSKIRQIRRMKKDKIIPSQLSALSTVRGDSFLKNRAKSTS